MKFSCASMAAIAALGLAVTVFSGSAEASPVILAFPGTGTTYDSASGGTGLIPSGGTSAPMFTAGDNVDETFTGTGLTSIDSLKVGFVVDNFLDGSDENLVISVNGTPVATFLVLDGGGSDGVTTISGSIFFAPIVGNGTYDLTITLEDTVPSGEGSIDFQDGGVFVLNGGVRVAAPEPVTLSLFGVGLGATIAIRRRSRGKIRKVFA